MLLGLSPTLVAALLTFGPETVSAERAAEIEFLTLAGSYGPHSEVRLLDDLAAGGRRAELAVLALGFCRSTTAYSWLVSLLDDGPAGRLMLGDGGAPVPPKTRQAAALALGCNGHPVGLVALRRLVEDASAAPDLRRAAWMGLSISPFACDRRRSTACSQGPAGQSLRLSAVPAGLLEMAARLAR